MLMYSQILVLIFVISESQTLKQNDLKGGASRLLPAVPNKTDNDNKRSKHMRKKEDCSDKVYPDFGRRCQCRSPAPRPIGGEASGTAGADQ